MRTLKKLIMSQGVMVKKQQVLKNGLHPRNPHNQGYDFDQLVALLPDLKPFVVVTPKGHHSINFADPEAVKHLNRALLKQYYNVSFWDIPEGYLCPAIPGRADYIHYLADLLAQPHAKQPPRGKHIQVLDIGAGANCVYPIIGSQSYGWSFVGSDINPIAVNCAKQLIRANQNLSGKIEYRLQTDSQKIFKHIIQAGEHFDLTLCNPPFHSSEAEASAGTERKLRNLNLSREPSSKTNKKPTLNFGGQQTELWCKGGEIAFLRQMVKESSEYAAQCLWFSSLVSKKENLPALYQALKAVNAKQVQTIEMQQGQKVSRIVAWSFMDLPQQLQWQQFRWKS